MPSFDPRVVAHIDLLTDVSYARLVSAARERGIEAPALLTTALRPATLERLREANAAALGELLDLGEARSTWRSQPPSDDVS